MSVKTFLESKKLSVAVLSLFVALSAFQLWQQDRDAEALVNCQNEYSNKAADALIVRSASTEEFQRGIFNVFVSMSLMLDDSADPLVKKELRDNVSRFLDTINKAEATRKKTPYPDPPRDTCKV